MLCNVDQYPMNIMNNALTIVTGAKFYPSKSIMSLYILRALDMTTDFNKLKILKMQ